MGLSYYFNSRVVVGGIGANGLSDRKMAMSYGRERYVAADEDRRAALMEDEMTDTLEQARALARSWLPHLWADGDVYVSAQELRRFCDLILTDALTREIENAAYERVAVQFDRICCVEAAKVARSFIRPAKPPAREAREAAR